MRSYSMYADYHRHNITDHVRELLEPHLLARKDTGGGNLCTGTPGHDLPPDYGDWENVYRRLYRGRDKGVGEYLLNLLVNELDQGSSLHNRSCWRKSGYGTYKMELDSKIHLAVDAYGMPVGMFVIAGTTAIVSLLKN